MKAILSWCVILFTLGAVGQGYLEQFPLHQKSQYFDFYYRRNPEKIAAIARFSDGFIKVVNRDFFKADFDYPIRTLVFEDRPTYQEFLRSKLQLSNPPAFGVYVPTEKMFATYEDSGLGTFTHEIMHPLIERNLSDHPTWALEGIPTFFEKFYGYWTNDDLVLHWGYQNPWRIAALGTNLAQIDLKQIILNKSKPVEQNESALRMVSVFLWEQGKFKRFLQLIAAKDKHGFNSYFEAAMEKPIDEVVPIWKVYLEKVAERRNDIMRLPNSMVLPNEELFEKYSKIYGF